MTLEGANVANASVYVAPEDEVHLLIGLASILALGAFFVIVPVVECMRRRARRRQTREIILDADDDPRRDTAASSMSAHAPRSGDVDMAVQMTPSAGTE